MRYLSIFAIVCLAAFSFAANALAQLGMLQGGRLLLNKSGDTVTIVPAATTSTYTMTLPSNNVTGLQYLGNDGSGNLYWGTPVANSGGTTALYNDAGSQSFTEPTANQNGNYIFDVVDTLGTGTAKGAFINVVANGPSSTSLMGLCDTARNKLTGTVTWSGTQNNGIPDEIACTDSANLAATGATGTAIGIQVSATGGGNNYACITKGGSVGIGVTAGSTGTDSLEVNGDVLISGQHGLKITEGTNACMGTTTLNGTSAVTVSTTDVTTNSRIMLTIQSPGAGTVGTPYVASQAAGSFTIKSTQSGDNSTVAWLVLLP